MKKLVIGSVMMVSIFAVGAMAEELTGFIGDSNCGAKHEAAAAKDVACAKGCIKKGADAVLLSKWIY